jgi:hypothetical protein
MTNLAFTAREFVTLVCSRCPVPQVEASRISARDSQQSDPLQSPGHDQRLTKSRATRGRVFKGPVSPCAKNDAMLLSFQPCTYNCFQEVSNGRTAEFRRTG